jgi:hypothetical protein
MKSVSKLLFRAILVSFLFSLSIQRSTAQAQSVEFDHELEMLGAPGNCMAYVKNWLLDHGYVDTYLPGTAAYQFASILPRYGFSRSGGPEDASTGMVCVWSGGSHGLGHTQVYNGRCFVDDKGCHDSDYPGSNYSLIGCYEK